MNRREVLKCALAPAAGLLSSASPSEAATNGPRAGYFSGVVLRTHENQTVQFYDLVKGGRLVVLNFMYTRCDGICPNVTGNLVKVQHALGDRVGRDIFFLSISLKPEEDTPMVLNAYARAHRVGPGWLFLTGRPAGIERLRRKLGFVDPDPRLDRDTSQHIGVIRFGKESLDRWAACPALTNPKQIVQSILALD
jgi:protein SCO1/2